MKILRIINVSTTNPDLSRKMVYDNYRIVLRSDVYELAKLNKVTDKYETIAQAPTYDDLRKEFAQYV